MTATVRSCRCEHDHASRRPPKQDAPAQWAAWKPQYRNRGAQRAAGERQSANWRSESAAEAVQAEGGGEEDLTYHGLVGALRQDRGWLRRHVAAGERNHVQIMPGRAQLSRPGARRELAARIGLPECPTRRPCAATFEEWTCMATCQGSFGSASRMCRGRPPMHAGRGRQRGGCLGSNGSQKGACDSPACRG